MKIKDLEISDILAHRFILDETSSGIEPIFGLIFNRNIEKVNKEYENVRDIVDLI